MFSVCHVKVKVSRILQIQAMKFIFQKSAKCAKFGAKYF